MKDTAKIFQSAFSFIYLVGILMLVRVIELSTCYFSIDWLAEMDIRLAVGLIDTLFGLM